MQVAFAKGERRGEPKVEMVAKPQVADNADHKTKSWRGFHIEQIGGIAIYIGHRIAGSIVVIHFPLVARLRFKGKKHLVHPQKKPEMVRCKVEIDKVRHLPALRKSLAGKANNDGNDQKTFNPKHGYLYFDQKTQQFKF